MIEDLRGWPRLHAPPRRPVISITGNYELALGDSGAVVLGNATSAAISVLLPQAADIYPGWNITIKKTDSSGNKVSADISTTAQTIDGASVYSATTQYQTFSLGWDGTSWHVIDEGRVSAGGGEWVAISTVAASAASSVDFANLLSATYDSYKIEGENLVTSSASAIIGIRFGYGGTPTYTAASYGYHCRCGNDSSTTEDAAVSNAAATGFPMNIASGGMSPDSAADTAKFIFICSTANSTARSKTGEWTMISATDQRRREDGGGACQDATSQANALTSLRVYLSTGTITGNFTLFGLKRT